MNELISIAQANQIPISLTLFAIAIWQIQKIKEELACINGKLTVLLMEFYEHDEKEKKKADN